MWIISSSSYYLCHACPRGTLFESHLSSLPDHVNLGPMIRLATESWRRSFRRPQTRTKQMRFPSPSPVAPGLQLLRKYSHTCCRCLRGFSLPPLIPTSCQAKSCAKHIAFFWGGVNHGHGNMASSSRCRELSPPTSFTPPLFYLESLETTDQIECRPSLSLMNWRIYR